MLAPLCSCERPRVFAPGPECHRCGRGPAPEFVDEAIAVCLRCWVRLRLRPLRPVSEIVCALCARTYQPGVYIDILSAGEMALVLAPYVFPETLGHLREVRRPGRSPGGLRLAS